MKSVKLKVSNLLGPKLVMNAIAAIHTELTAKRPIVTGSAPETSLPFVVGVWPIVFMKSMMAPVWSHARKQPVHLEQFHGSNIGS